MCALSDYAIKIKKKLPPAAMFGGLTERLLNHNEDEQSFVWHVRSNESKSAENVDQFFFHTDCSYEFSPPEYTALFVLEPDQLGGGQLQIVRLADILKCLSKKSKGKLCEKHFRINIPSECRKSKEIDHINAPILFDSDRIRYQSNILSEQTNEEFNELNSILIQAEKYQPKLNQYTMIILDNQKYLHRRTKILDHRRHILRIRFNRVLPFDVFSIYPKDKYRREYLTFTNDFYDYLDNQHKLLHQVMKLIVEQYYQPTNLGEEIRETFQFNDKIHSILTDLNKYRPNHRIGTYRPDILFPEGSLFKMNGKHSFDSKICEINARFPTNVFFASAALCSNDKQNRYSKRFSTLIETMINVANFDRTKTMFVINGKEPGCDIHLVEQYWPNKFNQKCLFIRPDQVQVEKEKLIDKNTNQVIEQFLLELEQDEILQLADEVLQYLIRNDQVNYLNDFRTIFILHDKRLFSLLSNEQFLYALLKDNSQRRALKDFIPITYVIKKIPNYLKDSIANDKEHWIIKGNCTGKGEDVIIGGDVTSDEWSRQLLDPNHREWIVQEYLSCIQYESMNLSGMIFCLNDQCMNMGVIRLSPKKIVNIAQGASCIRPYVHQERIHSAPDGTILSKEKLHEQLIELKTVDERWNENTHVASSGGSGGKRLFFATDIRENQLQEQILVNLMLEEEIIRHDDVCLNLFQSNNIDRSFEIFNNFTSIANCTTLPMNAAARDEDVLEVMEYFKPNVLMGSPCRLMQLAMFLEKQSQTNHKFEKIYFACESLDQYKYNYLKQIFRTSTFLGFYGSAETGIYACQSPKYSSTKIYLYPKELVHIEIIGSKIIVTNLIRKRNQLIRFDSGDLGRILPDQHNEKYGLIEVSTSERLIMVDGDVLTKSDIEETMKQFDLDE